MQVKRGRRGIELGDANYVSVKTARLEAGAARRLTALGIDPIEERRKVLKVIPTFEEAERRAHAEMLKAGRTASTPNNGSRRSSSIPISNWAS
jgi:hypothetical protein